MPGPDSYLNARRPPLQEALSLEGGTFIEAVESLKRKGYFTPPPRPWSLGVDDRGHGHMSYAVLDRFGDVVVEAGTNPSGQSHYLSSKLPNVTRLTSVTTAVFLFNILKYKLLC